MAGVSFEKLEEQLNWYSEAVSKGVRATAFGVIAAIWAIFTANGISLGDTGFLGIPTAALVKWAFVLAGAALMTDILQYVAGYYSTSIGVGRWDKRDERGEVVEFYYDRKNLGWHGIILYWGNRILLPVKLVLAILGAVVFLFLAFAVTVPSSSG